MSIDPAEATPAALDGPSQPDPPSVDPAVYHGILGEIALAAAPGTEGDPVGILATLMWGAGVLVGAGPHVTIANTEHPLLIWPMLFGRSGSGRKGEAHDAARVVLRQASAVYDDLLERGLSSGEGLIERIRDPDPNNDKDMGGTTEKRLLVEETEFRTVMARARRDGNSLAGIMRQAWEGRALTSLTRTKLSAKTSHIGIIGHVTPKEFRARLDDGEMAGGTYNRFLPVYVERTGKIPLPAGMPRAEVERLGSNLRSGITAASKLTDIGLDDDASKLWCDEVYDELTASDDEDRPWTEFTRRAAPYCRRIAALHAALGGRIRANKLDLVAAAATVRYALASAEYVMDRSVRDPRVDRLRRALDGAGRRGLSQSEVSALFSRKLDKDTLAGLVRALLETNSYERYDLATSGRSASMVRKAKKAK